MLEISSNPDNIRSLEKLVEEIAQDFQLTAKIKCNLLVSLTEAVNNAIIHGNRADEQKKVKIHFRQQASTLSVVVEDEGEGFDPQQVPDPTNETHIQMCGGRGVYLMKELSDEVHYSRNGSCVEIRFHIAS